ncbi:hypothetical protein BDV98DRAFT_279182 [Pterulicium gracile]|uniref:Uncharacterized protein n=1 Tax=Pterulicium gracile TaxID=1884261 RepID=A0A5C3QSI7_9AGAR|nr:hypothetical protein BDV98DRAFT_279182 [Pterula gracilis]
MYNVMAVGHLFALTQYLPNRIVRFANPPLTQLLDISPKTNTSVCDVQVLPCSGSSLRYASRISPSTLSRRENECNSSPSSTSKNRLAPLHRRRNSTAQGPSTSTMATSWYSSAVYRSPRSGCDANSCRCRVSTRKPYKRSGVRA